MTLPELRLALAAAEKSYERAQIDVDTLIAFEWATAILGVVFSVFVTLWLLPAFVVACLVMIAVRIWRSEPREKELETQVSIHRTALQYEEQLAQREATRNRRVEPSVSGTYARQVPWRAWN